MQITRTVPRRLMILQLRQIFFTDARTFMVVLSADSLHAARESGEAYQKQAAGAVTADGYDPRRWTQRSRPPPARPWALRFAFFINGSYWWDSRCACTCDIKSITTTTMMSSEVPPK